MLRPAFGDVGDDEAGIGSPAALCLDAGDHATLLTPTSRGIVRLEEPADAVLVVQGAAGGGILGPRGSDYL